jgi:hypothetical protein
MGYYSELDIERRERKQRQRTRAKKKVVSPKVDATGSEGAEPLNDIATPKHTEEF